MPGVASLEALQRAAADFAVTDLSLVMEPTALAAAQRSLDESGFLLLGEVHGVRENPLIARAQRPGVRGIRISYRGGRYYNIQRGRFRRRISPGRPHPRLRQGRDGLVLDLPAAGEAVVPQRPQPWPAGPRPG